MNINYQLHSIEQSTTDASIDEWRAQLKTCADDRYLKHNRCRLICADKQRNSTAREQTILSKRHYIIFNWINCVVHV